MKDAKIATELSREFQGLKRLVSTLALCGLGLVVANFAFDVWRRYDFERERKDIQHLFDQMTVRMETGDFLLDESGRIVESLEERLAAMSAQVGSVSEQAAFPSAKVEPEPSVPAPEQDDGSRADRLDPPLEPLEIFDASLEELLWGLNLLQGDPFVAQRYSNLLDPRTWKSEEIIADLEAVFGTVLRPEEREFAKRTIALYREATQSAYERYQIALDASIADRALEGDFDEVLPSGEFAAPSVSGREILAVALVGTKRYLWEKARFPELHRKNMSYQYLPLAMMERLRRFFSERNTQ